MLPFRIYPPLIFWFTTEDGEEDEPCVSDGEPDQESENEEEDELQLLGEYKTF